MHYGCNTFCAFKGLLKPDHLLCEIYFYPGAHKL